MWLASLVLFAISILFYSGIKKTGEKPNGVDWLSLAAVAVTLFCVKDYMCVERACISAAIPVLFVTFPIAMACLSTPPGSKGRASRVHRIVNVMVCIAAGAIGALAPMQ